MRQGPVDLARMEPVSHGQSECGGSGRVWSGGVRSLTGRVGSGRVGSTRSSIYEYTILLLFCLVSRVYNPLPSSVNNPRSLGGILSTHAGCVMEAGRGSELPDPLPAAAVVACGL